MILPFGPVSLASLCAGLGLLVDGHLRVHDLLLPGLRLVIGEDEVRIGVLPLRGLFVGRL